MKKRSISFQSFEDAEKEMIQQMASRTIQERIDYLKFLQRNHLYNPNAVDIDDIGKSFIELKRKI